MSAISPAALPFSNNAIGRKAGEIVEPAPAQQTPFPSSTTQIAYAAMTKVALALLHHSNIEPKKARENQCASQPLN